MKKYNFDFFEISKFKLYLLLQFIFIAIVLLYQLIWFTYGKNTMAECFVNGRINQLENSGTMVYRFEANGKFYEDYDTRNGAPVVQDHIEIKYLSFAPSLSRINSFESNWLGYFIAYGIFCTILSIIFLIPNDTMPRNSFFYFTKKKPWINMIVK
jgi:hypothetical protein